MATTVIVDQTTGGMETSIKLCVSVLIAFLTVTSIWADVVPPCVAQEAATLAGTTCAIADKSFSFGNFVNNTAIVIGFVPDVGDSGFTLSGYTAVSQSTNYVLPFIVETLNSSATIDGLATQILDPVLSGSGPENCDRPGCHITNSPFVQATLVQPVFRSTNITSIMGT